MFSSVVRMAIVCVALVLVLLMLGGPALAQVGGSANGQNGNNQGQNGNNQGQNGNNQGDPAPEIDPASATSAIALLVGGVLLLADKRRPKPKAC